MKKKKVLVLSDHALSPSGVGVQTRHLIEGLLKRHPGEWSFRQFGAAIKHANYDTVVVNEDFIVKPIDGFGNREMLRVTLAAEKPDILLIFTDPRFFIWLWEMEDEIHQVCPIAYWHVWDNRPTPRYNDVLYESTDLINCHSYLTYEMVSENFPERTNFIPHALPNDMFYPLPKQESNRIKAQVLGPERMDHMVLLWINRNAKRKRPNDLLLSFKMFLDALEQKEGHRKATLLLHTDPNDAEGPNLFSTVEYLGISDNIVFSTDRVDFEKMNAIHNISDACIQISFAEGFGLSTLESMQAGNPIIAVTTGGLTRQVIDHRDGHENGVAIKPDFQTLVGSQTVPYIFEDYATHESISNAMLKLYEMGPNKRSELGARAREYVLSEFSYDDTIDAWHKTLTDLHNTWKDTYKPWTVKEL